MRTLAQSSALLFLHYFLLQKATSGTSRCLLLHLKTMCSGKEIPSMYYWQRIGRTDLVNTLYLELPINIKWKACPTEFYLKCGPIPRNENFSTTKIWVLKATSDYHCSLRHCSIIKKSHDHGNFSLKKAFNW